MYSNDGHAKIKFHSDYSGTGNGFSLQYKLKSSDDGLPGVFDCSSCLKFESFDNVLLLLLGFVC